MIIVPPRQRTARVEQMRAIITKAASLRYGSFVSLFTHA